MDSFSSLCIQKWAVGSHTSRISKLCQNRISYSPVYGPCQLRRGKPVSLPSRVWGPGGHLGVRLSPANVKSKRQTGNIASARPVRAEAATGSVKVKFQLQRRVDFGMGHKVVGDHAALGSWNADNAPDMVWSEADIWTVEVALAPGTEVECKCVMVGNARVEWENGDNHKLQIPADAKALEVMLTWNQRSTEVTVVESAGSSSNGAPATEASSNGVAPPELAPEQAPEAAAVAAPVPAAFRSSDAGDERLPHQQWQGRSTNFMRSNEHSRERSGAWDSSALQGVARTIVEGDNGAPNWLSKMQVVQKVLVKDAPSLRPQIDALANAYIYLQWINTGAIECVEGGGHFRPNKHAELAREIFRSLEWVIGDADSSDAARIVARKVHTKLPSFTDQYTQSTPLTRIRDIAHRNDIPHDLKQEIKHTIQNKLHRNAGPEDLVATEEMLARVTQNQGEYPENFINEFRTFTAELRDFFNAGSFQDMLEGLRPVMDDVGAQDVDRFLAAKGKVDGAEGRTDDAAKNEVVDALHALTTLRASLTSGLASGLRNDAPDQAIAMRQKWRLCEIRAEEYSFVLLSRLLNIVEQQGSAEGLVEGGDTRWALPLGAALLAVRQLGLGGWDPRECLAVENELRSWQKLGGFSKQEPALRLKATLERVQRMTQTYTDLMLDIFPSRVTAMGSALQIEQERIMVFTESEIRANVVFQLSKLVTLLLKAVRLATGAGNWDAMVAGEAVGTLVEVDRIEPGALAEQLKGPVVLLVRNASGDEEVGAAGVNLKGVVLAHSLPHLSHLGVRARQEKVVFVMCEDEGIVEGTVRPLLGKQVRLTASSSGVTIEDASESAAAASSSASSSNGNGAALNGSSSNGNGAAHVAPSKATRVSKATIVPLEKATVDTCGSKSAACASLARVASEAEGFAAPTGVCLPFGNMEVAIEAAGKTAEFERLVAEVETASLEGGALDGVCQQLQQLVAAVRPSAKELKEACASFKPDALLIARSSANVEDLAGMSGAGLYDSLPNNPASEPEVLATAIAAVWASLYTRRAVLSRRAAGVKQSEATMAVLVQEQVSPDLSFVLHTVSPLDHDEDVLYAELAAGLGETLASGTRGSPWRLSVNKQTGEVKTLAFANFSQALVSAKPKVLVGAGAGGAPSAPAAEHAGCATNVVDYSQQSLSTEEDRRSEVGKKLAKVGKALEEAFKGPQDVEGAFVGDALYIVQTRPQP